MEPAEEKKPWYKNLFLWYFVIGAISLTFLRPFLRRDPPPPPVSGRLPAFELVDQNSKPFNLNDLEGKVWIANLIRTSSPSAFPPLTETMGRLQERFEVYGVDDVHLLSISVDPENDTPDVLRAYAAEHESDPERWTFLTGQPDAVRALVVDGFKTTLDSPKFVIVDGSGGIRGFYETGGEGLDEIYHRSRHVLREQREQAR